MKKISFILLMTVLLAFCACNNAAVDQAPASQINEPATNGISSIDEQQFTDTLSDWISGSDFGIDSGSLEQNTVVLKIPANKYNKLTVQDKQDIEAAINDILSYTGGADANCTIIFETENERIENDNTVNENASPEEESIQSDQVTQNGSTDNLIFIHHSCGENWLHDGLNAALNENGYHVADISYGWDVYGDNTDTTDWPAWFTDGVMNLVYNEKGAISANNSIAPNSGENDIVMFKSCYPNSDVGSDIADEKSIYNSLLPYFEAHPDKMFILVTPPPMINISNPAKTRELCNWLADRDAGWLAALSANNVFVFDFYNVLTHPDAHHYISGGQETHTFIDGANSLYYDSGGDDHPNQLGNQKATEEFMSLFVHWRALYMTD